MSANGSDHQRIEDRLDDYVDGELSPDARRDVEAHLEACVACRAALASRRALLGEAAALPARIEPAQDLWPAIRTRLEDHQARGRGGSPRRALAAAATVALLAGAAALTLWLSAEDRLAPAPPSAERTGADPDPIALVADWRTLEREYEGAAEELEQTLDAMGDELSPETRRIVERNLRVIDEAIAESRAALERDPASRDLARALRAAWSSKVEMLQHVTRL